MSYWQLGFFPYILHHCRRFVNAQVCAKAKMSLRNAIRFPTTVSGIRFCFLGRNYETIYLNTTDDWTQVFIKWKWTSNRFWGHCSLNGENVAGFMECSGIGTRLVYRALDDSSPQGLGWRRQCAGSPQHNDASRYKNSWKDTWRHCQHVCLRPGVIT